MNNNSWICLFILCWFVYLPAFAQTSTTRYRQINREINPACSLLLEKGGRQAQEKDFSAALSTFQEAARLCPGLFEAYNDIGCVYFSLNQLEPAIANFQKALQINSRYDSAYLNLGSAYYELGRLPEARDNFQHALELNPQDAEACYNLGRVYAGMGNSRDSRESFSRARQLYLLRGEKEMVEKVEKELGNPE